MWPAYRLVAEHWCTLADLDNMTADDVDTANMALDAWQEAGAKGSR